MGALLDRLQELYPNEYMKVYEALTAGMNLDRAKKKLDPDWYKKLQLYVAYPDSFCSDDQCNLFTLTEQLPHIKDLGCNTIHVLPFLSSPLIDYGFDISEYYIVRDEVGGNNGLNIFLERAQELNLHVFMDIVLNHVSFEHRWFKQAVSGDRFYRKFFISELERPTVLKVYENHLGKWARYQFKDREVDIRIIFPEQAKEVPHFNQAEDGYWYYHTFYPHQLDLNWRNYHVFVAFAKVMVYWAKRGMNFRLDAIPFVGKDVRNGQIESSPLTHTIVEALREVIKKAAPNCVFLVEANQPFKTTKRYFGIDNVIESELAYQFPLMNSMWHAIVTGDVTEIWKTLADTSDIPDWGGWVTFLRNHDELTLEYATPKVQEDIYKALIRKGLPFRGGHDIAGRLAGFMDNDPQKIVLAHVLLASLPGNPAIIYGDEIGKQNDIEYMHWQTEMKRLWSGDSDIHHDHRDANRGRIQVTDLDGKVARSIYDQLSQLFTTRSNHPLIATGKPKRLMTEEKGLFAARYEGESETIDVFVNLTGDGIQLKLPERGEVIYSVEPVTISTEFTLNPYSAIWIKSEK